MKILRLPRGGGKTHALLDLMKAKPNLVYVAPTLRQANTVWASTGADLDDRLPRWRFQSAGSMMRRPLAGRNDADDVEFVVDELESVLSILLSGPVFAATTSGPVSVVGTVV